MGLLNWFGIGDKNVLESTIHLKVCLLMFFL